MLSSPPSTSFSPRRCVLLTADSRSCASQQRGGIGGISSRGSRKQDRSCVYLRGPCSARRRCLGLHPPLWSLQQPGYTGDEGNRTPRHVFNLVSSGPDAEVVVHDYETLDSDAAGPVDIILVDGTHSGVVHHTIPDTTPTLITPPCTPPIDLLSHHHKGSSKWRSRASQLSLAPHGTVNSAHTGFTSLHTPYHSILSSPVSLFCLPSSSAPPFRNTDRPALGVG